jgi:hypothetical protein
VVSRSVGFWAWKEVATFSRRPLEQTEFSRQTTPANQITRICENHPSASCIGPTATSSDIRQMDMFRGKKKQNDIFFTFDQGNMSMNEPTNPKLKACPVTLVITSTLLHMLNVNCRTLQRNVYWLQFLIQNFTCFCSSNKKPDPARKVLYTIESPRSIKMQITGNKINMCVFKIILHDCEKRKNYQKRSGLQINGDV